jgi:hypothetical protein
MGVESMRFLMNRVAACAMLVACTAPVFVQAKEILNLNKLNSHPRIVRYDAKNDKIIRQESVVNIPLGNPPGGKESYSGSRLRQYRFVGKPGRGGIYDAFGEYQRAIGAEAKNYKYRIR